MVDLPISQAGPWATVALVALKIVGDWMKNKWRDNKRDRRHAELLATQAQLLERVAAAEEQSLSNNRKTDDIREGLEAKGILTPNPMRPPPRSAFDRVTQYNLRATPAPGSEPESAPAKGKKP